ncbi:hypothetical protein [Bradyrhizobium sp. CCBAU 53421]|uniref:hypothetical protein n=1 Tax=Bradyrhizobium sp. CCBAU 53421 TaxID=1325120 RepID=UPI00188B4F68|nr:hypothetical protein [Bradyrhizobium sp. CCBAU 53421]QOZ36140.1 hypothetical protein XH92_34315 [Bradyrhizobium sp. CCBAU 53421]
MNWLEFIEKMIGHIAWPGVVLIITFAVRKHLGSLAERILELSFGGATVKFDKLLAKGAEIVDQAPTTPPAKSEQRLEPPLVESDEIIFPANMHRHVLSPEIGLSKSARHILASMDQLDNLLYEIGDLIGIDAANPRSVAYALAAQKKMPTAYVTLYQSLREVRDVIAHTNTEPTKTEAQEYGRQVAFLKSFLTELRDSIRKEKPR